MNWLLIAVLSGPPLNNGDVLMERFPNQESCDSIKIWLETYSAVKKVTCLPDIDTPPDPDDDSKIKIKDLPLSTATSSDPLTK